MYKTFKSMYESHSVTWVMSPLLVIISLQFFSKSISLFETATALSCANGFMGCIIFIGSYVWMYNSIKRVFTKKMRRFKRAGKEVM